MSEVNGGAAQLAGDDAAAERAVARRDAAVAHAASYRCAECAAAATVDRGTWVRVPHAATCSRRRRHGLVARAGRRRLLTACASTEPRAPQPEHVPSAEAEPSEPQPQLATEGAVPGSAVRHVNRGRGLRRGSYTSCVRTGVRAGVVARWFVSGCRVMVQGWAATCRRIVREAGRLLVWVDFDEWAVNEPFDIFDLDILEWAAA